MDHLWFLLQERIECTQALLHSVLSHTTHSLRGWREGAKSTLLGTVDAIKGGRLGTEVAKKLSLLIVRLKNLLCDFDPCYMYDKCVYFIATEVTQVHVYIGGVCFLGGLVIGVSIGLRLQYSIVAPQKMRAVVANSYRGVESISLVEDLCAPRIVDPYQVIVQVKAGSIDYLDLRISQGHGRVLRKQLNKYNPNVSGEYPVVVGRDASGVIVAVGTKVTRVEQGDQVWLAVPYYHPGTLSEYIVVDENLVAQKPSQLTHEGAAALPYSIMTAWDALVSQAGLSKENTAGKRVLIHAGVSGVGVVAIQLVRAWGGHVTTTVTSQAAPLAHMLGAEDVISYDNSNFDKELSLREKYDVILNTVGQVLHDSCLKHCVPGGIVVTTAMSPLASDSYGYIVGTLYAAYIKAKYIFTKAPWLNGGRWGTLEVSGHVLEQVTTLVECGQLQAVVDKAYSAQDAEVAFAHVARGDQIGKTVIRFSINTPIRDIGMAFWQDL